MQLTVVFFVVFGHKDTIVCAMLLKIITLTFATDSIHSIYALVMGPDYPASDWGLTYNGLLSFSDEIEGELP
jgi:hypothetical protein